MVFSPRLFNIAGKIVVANQVLYAFNGFVFLLICCLLLYSHSNNLIPPINVNINTIVKVNVNGNVNVDVDVNVHVNVNVNECVIVNAI